MNISEFIKAVQEYYGMKYRAGALKYLLGYLEKQPFRLEVIFEETILEFSGQFKVLPDVSVYNKIVKAKEKYNKDYMVSIPGEREKFGYKTEPLKIVE